MAFTPSNPPSSEPAEILRWAQGEFERLARTLAETIALDLRPVAREPDKPRAGMIVSADGTNWDPGAGAGAYEFIGGVWVKL